LVHESVNPVVTHQEFNKPVQGSVTNLEPIVTTEIKPTIVQKEGLLQKDIHYKEGEMHRDKEFLHREGLTEVNPEYEAGLQEKKSLGTKIKELFTGPSEQKIE
jgi:hypothetical protein